MKKIACILLTVLFCYTAGAEDRFEVIYKQGGGLGMCMRIILDKKTNKQYLYYDVGYGGGLTKLETEDNYDLEKLKDDIVDMFNRLPFTKR